jgi:hypothetical protein
MSVPMVTVCHTVDGRMFVWNIGRFENLRFFCIREGKQRSRKKGKHTCDWEAL